MKKNHKYVIILGDGMSDYADENGQTPLTLALKPAMDMLAAKAEVGLVQTIPCGMNPGSDTANLAVMGFNPQQYYSGRSPLEALAMGVTLSPHDVSYRLNLVTLSDEADYAQKTMLDYSAGEIATKDAAKLIELLRPHVPQQYELFAGVSYRHCMVKRNSCAPDLSETFTPPHDITGKKIADFLPQGEIRAFMEKSAEVLTSSANPTRANSAWIWGAGTKPALPDFKAAHGVKGAVISAVDLIKGIGTAAGLTVLNVEGATGTLHTNWDGKCAAALDALHAHDFVFIHIEAADECGHQGDKKGKIQAIELLDKKIVSPIYNALTQQDAPFSILLLPDHATPLSLKTHTCDPVPYILYHSNVPFTSGVSVYSEASAQKTGVLVKHGHTLINRLLGEKVDNS
ncbi:MAG: cofactor-independent phosphoglycerate mutase [Firmicutes bacterium]|nr:cofactor-independent phosphoglycerate mutase [Bacillota bacterium]